ncbi:DUF2520 domain-containing protein [Flavicella sp.]|uniref:Rossmann-like and DUF2520 domain-containing protein n=1 Tax=Flavicella sp. TaxID=2957742 RepID=UPI003018DD48
MIRVVLLGGGNLASHLANAFLNSSSIELVQIYNRTLAHIENKKNRVSITNTIQNLKKADIYIIATTDATIESISNELLTNTLVVHTSGAMPNSAIKQDRKGVFYPLQTFTKNEEIDFREIPICLEATYTEDYFLLEKIAKELSPKVYSMNSEQRKKLHIAAVFVNNFVNHMYSIGEDICQENNIPFEILYPLIEETFHKITKQSPKEVRTGPAIRKDEKTLALHKSQLNSNQKKIYTLISEAIANTK